MRRSLKISGWVLGGVTLLALIMVGGVIVAGNTAPGRLWIESLTYRLTGGYVRLTGLGGTFPWHLTARELQLVDRSGPWLIADDLRVTWSPLELLYWRVEVLTLQAVRVHVERTPLSDGQGGQSGKTSIPDIEVGRFSIPTAELGAPLVGSPTSLSLDGGMRMRSLDDAKADLVAHRLNGEGDYTLHLRFDPRRMDGSLALHEPASGPLENLLSVPGLGALTATATVQGPRNAALIHLDLSAGGLQARVEGSLDLSHAAADLKYSLTAPAMAPRPDLAWDRIALRGSWRGAWSSAVADGLIEVERLRIAQSTRIATLAATLTANQGRLGLHTVIGGLEIPGPQPRLFAGDPLVLDASLRPGPTAQPLEVKAKHRLFTLQGRTDLAQRKSGQWSASADLRLPDLAAFSGLTGQDARGSAVLNARWAHAPKGDTVALDGNVGVTGGTAPWVRIAAPQVALQLSGVVTPAHVSIDNARIAARSLILAASGGADRVVAPTAAGVLSTLKNLQFRWQLEAPDLGALSDDVKGQLKMTGRLSGSPASLVADAQINSRLSVRDSPSGDVAATLHARGLPRMPSGTLQAHGTLDGSPLGVDVAVERGGADLLRVVIRQADWKSAHLEGDLSADASLTKSKGKLTLHVAELGDFNRLLGTNLSGSLDGDAGFVPSRGQIQGQLHLDGKNLIAGALAGTVHLDAVGVPNALELQLNADLTKFYGGPATLASSAKLDLGAAELHIASASLGLRGESVKMLAPATLSFGTGLALDDFKIGLREAILEVKGQFTPTLDMRASLQQVRPDLVNVFAPDLVASGLIEARARLQGTLARPTGAIHLDANDIRFADDAATGLPAMAVHARADLTDGQAALDATLTAGIGSQLTASGSVPLDAAGEMNVKVGGTLDVGMANPFLEARGLHATGLLTTDASLSGSLRAPQAGGGITLANGSLRDYGRGVNLSDISAQVVGNEGGFKIQSFQAKAASGSISMSGTFGLLQPGLPLDLEITAKNAQPIASSIVTATLDAGVHVSGTARQRLDVTGKIHVLRATIGIPNSLPPDVAVLDVRRRGQAVQADAGKQLVIGMDITVEAPHQILVQGRGLNAEMGGEIHLTGTTDEPFAAGGLDLQRGSFTLAGNKLTFTQGRVSFDGAGLKKKIDPTLDFMAQTSLSSSTATLRITGLADAPRFEFSSSPPLPQDEIMAQLLFGENAAQLTAIQAAEIGAALATLSGVGGGDSNPLVKLQRTLGLDRLAVGSNTTSTAAGTENSGAAIEAGRYISKRVYVEGKQSTQGTSQVQVDVDLTKHLKLQTRLGNGTATTQGTTPENDPGSSVGLSYQFEY